MLQKSAIGACSAIYHTNSAIKNCSFHLSQLIQQILDPPRGGSLAFLPPDECHETIFDNYRQNKLYRFRTCLYRTGHVLVQGCPLTACFSITPFLASNLNPNGILMCNVAGCVYTGYFYMYCFYYQIMPAYVTKPVFYVTSVSAATFNYYASYRGPHFGYQRLPVNRAVYTA